MCPLQRVREPEILKGVSFDVEADDFFAIIGPSGAGKSTLIRCINRLVEPTSGAITFHGDNILKLGLQAASPCAAATSA